MQVSKQKAKKNQDSYVIAVCTQFTRKFIELNKFDRSEAITCLNIVQELMLRLRIPDLGYLVLNSFEDLKNKDFFQSQKILQGKSLCDICITDQKSIRKGISEDIDPNEIQILHGSVIENIIAGDGNRRNAMIKSNIYPNQLIV